MSPRPLSLSRPSSPSPPSPSHPSPNPAQHHHTQSTGAMLKTASRPVLAPLHLPSNTRPRPSYGIPPLPPTVLDHLTPADRAVLAFTPRIPLPAAPTLTLPTPPTVTRSRSNTFSPAVGGGGGKQWPPRPLHPHAPPRITAPHPTQHSASQHSSTTTASLSHGSNGSSGAPASAADPPKSPPPAAYHLRHAQKYSPRGEKLRSRIIADMHLNRIRFTQPWGAISPGAPKTTRGGRRYREFVERGYVASGLRREVGVDEVIEGLECVAI